MLCGYRFCRTLETWGWPRYCACEVKDWACYDCWSMSIVLDIKLSDIYCPVNLGGLIYFPRSGYAQYTTFKSVWSRRLGTSWRWTLHPPKICTPQYLRTIMALWVWPHRLEQLQRHVTLPWSIIYLGNILVRVKGSSCIGWNPRSRWLMCSPNGYHRKYFSI